MKSYVVRKSSVFWSGFFVILFVVMPFFNDVAEGAGKAKPVQAGVGEGAKIPSSNMSNTEIKNNSNIFFDGPFDALFQAVNQVIAALIVESVGIIKFTMTENMMSIFNNPGLYTGWVTVRDFLNLFFIFFLLYSAFCTVFQVSKYHIRSTWVMIVVMALLVNFSWPISRVMIDASNLAMVYILEGSGIDTTNPGEKMGGIMAQFGEHANVLEIMLGTKKTGNVGSGFTIAVGNFYQYFRGIIIGFMFLVTIVMIAFMLLIRIIMLAILIIFSSAGFTLSAFPSTASQASQWWNSFVKQCFVGPILLFMLLLAGSVLNGFGEEIVRAQKDISAVEGEMTKGILEFVVTIALLWAGILAAGKIGDGASSAVVSRAQGAITGTANKIKRGTVSGGKFVGRNAAESVNVGIQKGTAKMTGGTGLNLKAIGSTTKQRFKNYGDKVKNAQQAAHDEAKASYMGMKGLGQDKNAGDKLQNQKYIDASKGIKEKGLSHQDSIGALAKKDLSTGERRAHMEHALKGDFDDKSIDAIMKHYEEMGVETQKAFIGKIKDSGFAHKLKDIKAPGQDAVMTYKDIYGGMDAKTLAKQNVFKNPNSNLGGFQAARKRFESLSTKSQQEAMDSMNMEAGTRMKKMGEVKADRARKKAAEATQAQQSQRESEEFQNIIMS